MSVAAPRKFRVLLAGYINLNVIDGSAFFLSGFAGMCARHPYVEVNLVTANPVRSWEVLDELSEYPNVEVTDPYSMMGGYPELLEREYISRDHYASILARTYESGDYDAVLVRDNAVALKTLQLITSHSPNLHAYVTGFTFLDHAPDIREIERLEAIVELGGKLVCQTEEIKNLVLSHLDVAKDDLWLLPPHVPDPEPPSLRTLSQVEQPSQLVYTGKFFKDWNIDSILAAIKSVNIDGGDLSLDVAGDQFRHPDEDDFFVDNVNYLLKNTPGVEWHGRVPRNVSRSLIARSHVGIGWRSERLDSSSELSTKILEYGALGRPSIINRTSMHENLLGSDYPLFANSMSEFRGLLGSLRSNRDAILEAANRCFRLARKHSYSTVSKIVLPHLGNLPKGDPSLAFVNGPDLTALIPETLMAQRGRVILEGIWVEVVVDPKESRTIGELARIVERDYLGWRHAASVTRDRIEAYSDSDNLHALGSSNLSVRMESQGYENVKALRNVVEELQAERDQLSKQMTTLNKDLDKALEREDYWRNYAKSQVARLEALRGSRLGRLQTFIWKDKKPKH